MTRLSQLYADLALYEFYLDYLHDSLGKYYAKKQTYWTPQYRRRQIEDIRATIPLVYEDVNEIKKEIEYEKSRNQRRYYDENSDNEEEYYEEDDEYYNKYSYYDHNNTYDNYLE
jgi:hypothetical protein